MTLTDSQKRRICPHCAAKGKVSLGGVELIQGENEWDRRFQRIPGGQPFCYVYAPYSKVWCCPGCLDVREELPEQETESKREKVAW